MTFHSRARQPSSGETAAIYQQGLAAFERGQYLEAIELLSSIAETDHLAGTLARFYLGQAHMRHGVAELRASRHAPAARHLTTARQINPDSVGLSRYLAASYAGQGRFDLAAAELEYELDDGVHDIDQSIRLAHAFAHDGQMPRAVETLVNILDDQPHRVDVRMQLGLLYAAAEQFEDAICVFQEAAELAPLDPEIRQNLGLALSAAGDHDQAVEHLAVAQKLRPHNAYIALLLTLAIDAARATCVKLAIEPETSELKTVDDHSLELLGDLITEDPDFVEAFLSLPMTEVDADLFAMLAAILENALERHPDYADLYHHCARVHQRLGLTESAIIQARMAVQINPRYVQALIQLGRLYAETDQSAEAIQRLQTAVENGGDYPDVHYLLGKLHGQAGNKTEACGAFQRALELNAGYTRAQTALEAITSR